MPLGTRAFLVAIVEIGVVHVVLFLWTHLQSKRIGSGSTDIITTKQQQQHKMETVRMGAFLMASWKNSMVKSHLTHRYCREIIISPF